LHTLPPPRRGSKRLFRRSVPSCSTFWNMERGRRCEVKIYSRGSTRNLNNLRTCRKELHMRDVASVLVLPANTELTYSISSRITVTGPSSPEGSRGEFAL
jgi:hypothetical protein